MNKIINKFLLTGLKFMPELHLKQPGSTLRACGPFAKHCKRIQKFRETFDLKYLCRKKLDKVWFAHDAAYSDAAYSDSKDLAKRSILDKILKDRAYEITRNRKYDGYQRALATMVHKFFLKKTGSGVSVNKKN